MNLAQYTVAQALALLFGLVTVGCLVVAWCHLLAEWRTSRRHQCAGDLEFEQLCEKHFLLGSNEIETARLFFNLGRASRQSGDPGHGR